MSIWFGLKVGYLFSPADKNCLKEWQKTDAGQTYMEMLRAEIHGLDFEPGMVKLASSDGQILFAASLRRWSFPASSYEVVPVAALLAGSLRELDRDVVDIKQLSWPNAEDLYEEGARYRLEDRQKVVAEVTVNFEQMLAQPNTPDILKKRGEWVGPIEFFVTHS